MYNDDSPKVRAAIIKFQHIFFITQEHQNIKKDTYLALTNHVFRQQLKNDFSKKNN